MDQTSSHPLLRKAAAEAKKLVTKQIRAALRETAVQGLRLVLQHRTNAGDGDGGGGGLRLEASDLKVVEQFCLFVAEKWSEQLKQLGHDAVASWILDVARAENSILYYSSSGQPSTAPPPAPPPPVGQNDKKPTAMTVVGELRRLGEHNILAPEDNDVPTAQLIKRLDEIGRSRTLPYSWDLVERAVAEIPSRLHKNKKRKELPESEDPEQAVIQRTRKSRGSRKPPPRPVAEVPMQKKEEPRPAADCNEMRISSNEIRSIPDKAQLDAYLHCQDDDDNNDKKKPAGILLGALQDVGWFHHYQQAPIDRDDIDASQTRRLKIRQRHSIKERLGDHSLGDAEEKKLYTRVLRTTSPDDRQWLDVDLGHCLLETANGNSRDLYAFSSAELMLLDEEDSSEMARQQDTGTG
jgi:hypothetical protein